MLRFSIIIPIYNVEEYLEQCVRSILSQNCIDYEIILVDDGSPDKCPQFCDDFAACDDRIKVIHKTNGGISSARNAGIAKAKGEYLLLIDSDDYICDPNFLEDLNVRIAKYHEDVILFGCKIENPDKTYINSRYNYDFRIINDHNKGKTLQRLYEQNNFPGSAWIMCVRQKVIKNNRLQFRLGVTAEDQEWIIKVLLASYSIGAIDGIQYVYRRRDGSISSKPRMSGLYGTIHAIEYYLGSNIRNKGLSKFVARIYLVALMGITRLNDEDKKIAVKLLRDYMGVLLEADERIVFITLKCLGIARSADVVNIIHKLFKR